MTARMLQGIAIYLFCGSLALAQQTENRLLKKELVPPVEPVPLEITNLRVNENPINFDEPFSADSEWVKGLTFDVKNVSGKKITHFKIGLHHHTPNVMVNMIFHGRDTGLPNNESTVQVAPNEVIHAIYEDKRYEQFKQMRDRFSLSSITELTLSIEMVVFEDETMWRMGNLLRRDPANPMRWNVISNPALRQ